MLDRVRHIPLKIDEKVKSNGLLAKDIFEIAQEVFPPKQQITQYL